MVYVLETNQGFRGSSIQGFRGSRFRGSEFKGKGLRLEERFA